MNIFSPCINPIIKSEVVSTLSYTLADVSNGKAKIIRISYEQDTAKLNISSVVIVVESYEEYLLSLQFIQTVVYPAAIPFLYFQATSHNFPLELVESLQPAELLCAPFSRQDYLSAITRFLDKVQVNEVLPKKGKNKSEKIWLPIKRGSYQNISLDSISYIEAEDHYIWIYLDQSELPKIKYSLTGFYEDYLSGNRDFLLLSRSHIVNVNKIEKIESYEMLVGNITLPIPKDKKSEILTYLGL